MLPGHLPVRELSSNLGGLLVGGADRDAFLDHVDDVCRIHRVQEENLVRQFGLMLMNGGQLNGKRLLSPRTVELMRSAFIPDTLPGRARGESFGLSVRVVTDPIQRGTALSTGSFGWSGAYGTHFWVDPKEKVVAILMTQTADVLDFNAGIRDIVQAASHIFLEAAPQQTANR